MTQLTGTPQAGLLVTARGRDWVVQPGSSAQIVKVRPLGGDQLAETVVFPGLEDVEHAEYTRPTLDDVGGFAQAGLLRTALRIGFRSSAGPLRSLAGINVEPRQYQLVPLLLALKQDPVRLLIADDVGIGKTIEAGLIAKELLEQGSAARLTVLCSPALAEQWQQELREKFGIDATPVLASTARRLEREIPTSESIFEHHRFTVVSTDFIKADTRRATFVRTCPELVIVDEAHTCVPDAGVGRGHATQLRYALLKQLASEPVHGRPRHLILVTATPHSGKEESFRALIGLLDPQLATLDLDQPRGRERLAAHFVQRRRRDIRTFLKQETSFPTDRFLRESGYHLSEEYGRLFREVLEYARESVRSPSGAVQPRARWWAALALLRAMASSPMAAAASLRTRADGIDTDTDEQADELGREAVMDAAADDRTLLDVVPGGDAAPADDDAAAPGRAERSRLQAWAARAEQLAGDADTKLELLTKEVKGLLADGYNPIVFCRFIATADYVREELARRLGKRATVVAITGELPPDERLARIDALADIPGHRVLVATDCLSEGVNLQEFFDAVVHYDLAWNPTRHEQREGRVDRFGQRTEYVRAITIYGVDNGIDALVLKVLIRKHQSIRKQTGVVVPVPEAADRLLEALFDELLRSGAAGEQLELDFGPDAEKLHETWQSAADQEGKAVTKYAHTGSSLLRLQEEVQREIDEIRATLGGSSQIPGFVRWALGSLGAPVHTAADGTLTAGLAPLPVGLRHALSLASGTEGSTTNGKASGELVFRPAPPAARTEAVLQRTDPKVAVIAQYILDAALDKAAPARLRPASRCGVTRTSAVNERTVLILARYRYHVELPQRSGGTRKTVAEDARVFAFDGPFDNPRWLADEEVERLLALAPDDLANTAEELARSAMGRVLDRLDGIQRELDEHGGRFARALLESHIRVREAAGAPRRGLTVNFQPHADILGVYVYQPLVQSSVRKEGDR
jgi:superfamily II DNA or RNA helicase